MQQHLPDPGRVLFDIDFQALAGSGAGFVIGHNGCFEVIEVLRKVQRRPAQNSQQQRAAW